MTPTGMIKSLGTDMQFLRSNGITSAEDLLNRIAADPDFIAKNLPDDASKLRVAWQVSEFALASGKKITRSRVRNHLADICVGLAILLVLYGIFRERIPAKAPVTAQVVVSKANGLDPYQAIGIEDVTLSSGAANPSAFTSTADVVGKYATEHIQKGTALDRSKLNSGTKLSNELDHRRIIRLKLQPTTVLVGFQTPIRLDLLAAPRDKEPPALFLHEIYIVDFHVEADGISAVVAATPTDFDKLAPLISRSDLYAVGPAH